MMIICANKTLVILYFIMNFFVCLVLGLLWGHLH